MNARTEVHFVKDQALLQELDCLPVIFLFLADHSKVEIGVDIDTLWHIDSLLVSLTCMIKFPLLFVYSSQAD